MKTIMNGAKKKAKVAICQHCDSVVMLSDILLAETDKDIKKDFTKAAKQGLIIDMLLDEEWKAKNFGHTPECIFSKKRKSTSIAP